MSASPVTGRADEGGGTRKPRPLADRSPGSGPGTAAAGRARVAVGAAARRSPAPAAAPTPGFAPTSRPWEAAGLTAGEYRRACALLGRAPNPVELGLIGVLWSEHCAYKHSKPLLRRLPTRGPQVLLGPGENAGAVDLGDGTAVVFRIESHNHPSFVEPFQGAATGVGGILRDVLAAGARPVALMDFLAFADPAGDLERRLVRGVVAGIAAYGNCTGVPVVGGRILFEPGYRTNPLVNVLCVGVAPAGRLLKGVAAGPGARLVLIGPPTGRDGVHGATFASAGLGGDAADRRPAVQVGDPLAGKVLIEACLELVEAGLVAALQDLGAGGLGAAAAELASRARCGATLTLDRVPLREPDLPADVILLAESQERMLAVVEPDRLGRVRRIARRWGLPAVVVGRLEAHGRFRVRHRGRPVADVPVDLLTRQAPVYGPADPVAAAGEGLGPIPGAGGSGRTRPALPDPGTPAAGVSAGTTGHPQEDPRVRPEVSGQQVEVAAAELDVTAPPTGDPDPCRPVLPATGVQVPPRDVAAGPPAGHPEGHPDGHPGESVSDLEDPAQVAATLRRLLASPAVAAKTWVYGQFDHLVGGRTRLRPGAGPAAVLEVPGCHRLLAVAMAGTGRQAAVDPCRGAALAVAEAALRVSCVGGRPLGLTNGLNLGDPRRPAVYGQLAGLIDGLAAACRALDLPVTGGNVSLYNETAGRDIDPTVAVGVVGVIPPPGRWAAGFFPEPGLTVALLGPLAGHLGASEYLKRCHGRVAGPLPEVPWALQRRLQQLLAEAVARGWVLAARPVGRGGLLVALAKMAFPGGPVPPAADGAAVTLGVDVTLPDSGGEAGFCRWDAVFFGEGPARVLVAVVPGAEQDLVGRAAALGIPCRPLGQVTGPGGRLTVRAGGRVWLDEPVAQLWMAWEGALPWLLDEPARQPVAG
nr:AIR synthase-related protein [Thermaerobacter marianensis]